MLLLCTFFFQCLNSFFLLIIWMILTWAVPFFFFHYMVEINACATATREFSQKGNRREIRALKEMTIFQKQRMQTLTVNQARTPCARSNQTSAHSDHVRLNYARCVFGSANSSKTHAACLNNPLLSFFLLSLAFSILDPRACMVNEIHLLCFASMCPDPRTPRRDSFRCSPR